MSHIEVGNGVGTTFVGRAAVDIYRLMVMRSAVRLESLGMRHSRGSRTALARKEFGLRPRAPHALVIDAIDKKLFFLRNTVPVIHRDSEGNPAAPTVVPSGPTGSVTE